MKLINLLIISYLLLAIDRKWRGNLPKKAKANHLQMMVTTRPPSVVHVANCINLSQQSILISRSSTMTIVKLTRLSITAGKATPNLQKHFDSNLSNSMNYNLHS